MIRTFRHKGLRAYFQTGSRRGIRPDHSARLARILDRLDASIQPSDMGLPGFGLHRLSGAQAGVWAVSVSGSWRVTFRFDGPDAVEVDYVDYHFLAREFPKVRHDNHGVRFADRANAVHIPER